MSAIKQKHTAASLPVMHLLFLKEQPIPPLKAHGTNPSCFLIHILSLSNAAYTLEMQNDRNRIFWRITHWRHFLARPLSLCGIDIYNKFPCALPSQVLNVSGNWAFYHFPPEINFMIQQIFFYQKSSGGFLFDFFIISLHTFHFTFLKFIQLFLTIASHITHSNCPPSLFLNI